MQRGGCSQGCGSWQLACIAHSLHLRPRSVVVSRPTILALDAEASLR